jgi:hypothetical protein
VVADHEVVAQALEMGQREVFACAAELLSEVGGHARHARSAGVPCGSEIASIARSLRNVPAAHRAVSPRRVPFSAKSLQTGVPPAYLRA